MNQSLFFATLLILSGCVPVTNTTSSTERTPKKKLLFQDRRYEQSIRSDILYPNRGFVQDVVQSSVVALQGETRLILEFDDVNADYQDYSARLIHCNADWSKSNLTDLEFSAGYNEYPIRTFDYSQGSKVPYTHYTFEVPKVKRPGNYLLVVYRETNGDDFVLSRRFVVFDSRVQVKPTIAVMTGAVGRFQNHQIEFEINYQGMQILNPYNDVKVVIRQNQRWDNAITSLAPTQVKEDRKTLVYRHFTRQNTFVAMNEFRFVDLRSTSFKGQNIARIEKDKTPMIAYAGIDKPRTNSVYSQYSDINGSYVIENNDPGADYLEEDYIFCHFSLDYAQISDPIYLIGAFNNWQLTSENRLEFDQDRKLYTASILLKQGYYNYQYFVPNGEPNPYYLEGAFFEAENDYDIIVYYRGPGEFTDRVIGYASFESRN